MPGWVLTTKSTQGSTSKSLIPVRPERQKPEFDPATRRKEISYSTGQRGYFFSAMLFPGPPLQHRKLHGKTSTLKMTTGSVWCPLVFAGFLQFLLGWFKWLWHNGKPRVLFCRFWGRKSIAFFFREDLFFLSFYAGRKLSVGRNILFVGRKDAKGIICFFRTPKDEYLERQVSYFFRQLYP